MQTALTQVLVRQLFAACGTDLQLAEPFLASVVQQVVQSACSARLRRGGEQGTPRARAQRGSTDFVVKLARSYDEIRNTLEQVAPKLAASYPANASSGSWC